jgi:iron(III) transport system substrate-binding protein
MNRKPDQPGGGSNWPKDEFGRSEAFSQFWTIWLPILLVLGILLWGGWNASRKEARRSVVVYCAQDQVYAEPIFREIEQRERVRIRAVYDSEAVKTVGLANRLLAERRRPQCDVYWGNEEMRTRQLAAQQVFTETNGWAAFGFRSRRIVINTNLVSLDSAPRSLLELTNASWKQRVALAYPLFGTTATHFHALRQHWGREAWDNWCRGLAGNQPVLVDGNSVVVKLVGAGQAAVGLTDSDDIAAGQREKLPVMPLPLDGDSLLIPNTVGLIRGAPHPALAMKVFLALQEKWVAERLVAEKALESASPASTPGVSLAVDWDKHLGELVPTTARLKEIFLR